MRLSDDIDQELFATKHTQLRDRLASIKLQLDVLDRSHYETAELAANVFTLANPEIAMAYCRLRHEAAIARNRVFELPSRRRNPLCRNEKALRCARRRAVSKKAERGGFEPPVPFRVHSISSAAQSAALSPLQIVAPQRLAMHSEFPGGAVDTRLTPSLHAKAQDMNIHSTAAIKAQRWNRGV